MVDDDKLHSSMTIYNHNNAKSMDLCGHCTGDLVLRRFKKEIEAVWT